MFYKKIIHLLSNRYQIKHKKRIKSATITFITGVILILTVSNSSVINTVDKEENIKYENVTHTISEEEEDLKLATVEPKSIFIVGNGLLENTEEPNKIEKSVENIVFDTTETLSVGLNTDSDALFQFDDIEYIEVDTQLESNVPNYEEGCKSYNFTFMDYRTVTSVNTTNYKILNSDLAYTDENTGLRMYDGLYCVAVGTFYALPGEKIDITMTNGTVFHCIVGDAKSNVHTDPTNRYHSVDGSVVEMIVDKTVFTGTSMYPAELKGTVHNIIKTK